MTSVTRAANHSPLSCPNSTAQTNTTDPTPSLSPATPPAEVLDISTRWLAIILVIIFAWQVAWLCYGVTTIFRKTSYGFLYVAPGYMHPSVYWCFSCANLCCVATLILLYFDINNVSLTTTVVAMAFVYAALFMSLRRVYIRAPVLIREGRVRDVWMARVFVHNGLAALATFLTFVTLFHFASVLTYIFEVSRELSVTISLNVIFLEILVWFFVDSLVFDRFTRYTVSPYGMALLNLLSILTDSDFADFSSSNSVLVTFMLGVTCLTLLLKVAVVSVRHVRAPLFTGTGFSAVSKNYGTLDYGTLYSGSEHRTLL